MPPLSKTWVSTFLSPCILPQIYLYDVCNQLVDVMHEPCRGRGGPDVPQDAIQALDVALKHSTTLNPTAFSVARAFFFPDPTNTRSLTGGAEVRKLQWLPSCAYTYLKPPSSVPSSLAYLPLWSLLLHQRSCSVAGRRVSFFPGSLNAPLFVRFMLQICTT